MAGTLDLLQRGYLGTEIVDDVVYFNPTVLDRLDGLRLPLQIRRTPITVSINGRRVMVTVLAEGYTRPITVSVHGAARELKGGESCSFELQPRPDAIDDIDHPAGKAVAELGE
jgi:trehalose/maltose hydrolase-like predicted phosphorylase